MGKIHLLPQEIISKIAAGEVIERPASVVKELLENALDADSQSIELYLKEAGKSLIHLKDTGTGIDNDDMENVFLRHSTSKIKSTDDLYRIASLGFRGEALYSISAVSDVLLRSKTASGDSGWEIHTRANQKLSLKPCSLNNGTEVEVKELFFNTPARKKFLKSDTSELNHILNLFMPYTLLYPQIRFLLVNNARTLVDLIPAKNYLERYAKALNLEEENIMEVNREFADSGLKIHLLLGDINIQRTAKDMQFIFINDRPVYNRSLNFHMNQVYRLIFPSEVNPFFAVYINMPPSEVDVNVHPTKREVKFRDEYRLISFLRSFCEHTLMTKGKAKQIKEPVFTASDTTTIDTGPLPALKESPAQQFMFYENIPAYSQQNLNQKLSSCQYLGTFKSMYLLFETADALILIDQHAAHERITFEKFKRQIDSGRIEIQQLLTPLLLRLSRQEILMWEENKNRLEGLGFSTTLWDKDSIAIHSHPQLIRIPEMSVRNILSEEDLMQADTDILARRACRQSVMVGDKIGKDQAIYLKDELLKCLDPFTCPHGRPTVVEIPATYIDKQFLRK